MKDEKVTIYDNKLGFKNSGKFFILRGFVLKMITVFKFITTDSPDANLILDFLDGIRFDTHTRSKSLRDRNVIKIYFNKRSPLSSGLEKSETTILFSEEPKESFDRFCLISQEKQAENVTNRLDKEVYAKIDKLLEYKCITLTQHKFFFLKILISYKIRLSSNVVILVDLTYHLWKNISFSLI